jgi:nucleoside phosphorylase
VDVLIITAIKEEYDATRAVLGRSDWTDHDSAGETPYATARHGALSVALARPTRMGGRSTAAITTTLTDRLKPTCLAMCGVCAGNPSDTAPGDVIVAAPAYEWDEGKHTGGGFLPAPEQFPQEIRWVRAVQDFVPDDLPSYGRATEQDAAVWILERLHKGQDPIRHPARKRYFTSATWAAQLAMLESTGLIVRLEGRYALTAKGLDTIRHMLSVDLDGPARLPFKVHAGPMASGSAVMAVPGVWDELAAHQRKVLALDMEAATVATIGHDKQVPHWLIAKGVSDHADDEKDDRFKAFAAKASAEVLFALLERLLTAPAAAAAPAARVPDRVRQEVVRQLRYLWQDIADIFGVPSYETRRFRAGDEPHDLWAWLEQRRRLTDLPGALDDIGRPDLAELLRPYA